MGKQCMSTDNLLDRFDEFDDVIKSSTNSQSLILAKVVIQAVQSGNHSELLQAIGAISGSSITAQQLLMGIRDCLNDG